MDVKKVNGSGNGSKGSNEWRVKVGLAEMLKGGVIYGRHQRRAAKIAENAGACAGDGAGACGLRIFAKGRRGAHGLNQK